MDQSGKTEQAQGFPDCETGPNPRKMTTIHGGDIGHFIGGRRMSVTEIERSRHSNCAPIVQRPSTFGQIFTFYETLLTAVHVLEERS